jgi:hemerythrin
MALFQWRDEFSMKVPSIDAQHRKLVEMLNSLHDGMLSGTTKEKLAPLLNGLIEYTATHFAHEEEYFATYQYPDAQKHTQEHQKLVKQVLDFKEKFDSGRASINMELMVFLKDWLLKHILGSDKGYSKHFVEHGAK